jgi:hypothetical protein
MEYSLKILNQKAQLKNIKIDEIINALNLIGFEIDNIFFEPSSLDSFSENIRILVKIPSNREDLLNENFFLIDLSMILMFQISIFWGKLKQKNSVFIF